MLAPEASDSKSVPRPPAIIPALAAMTALQMLVSCAMFAPGVMAPRIGIDATTLGLYATATCVVSIFTTFIGGMLAGRFGAFRVATFCAAAVLCATAVSAYAGAGALLIVAGIILGCAYGPETPASSSVLSRITPPAQRPMVFSLRQTGNQSGAMIGSLVLPWLAASDPLYGYAAIMVAAVAAVIAFELLRPTYDPLVRGATAAINLRDALMVLSESRDLRQLAVVSVSFSALQISLNTFLVTFGVSQFGLTLVSAGILLATAQCGGFVGRIVFGLVAMRYVSAWATLAGLGFGMSACAVTMALASATWSWPLLLAVAFFFGVTASGWNGVFLAEVARLAPEGRVAEATGAVLVPGFTGLVLGPLLVAGTAGMIGLGGAYAVLGAVTLAGTLVLIAGRHR
jgi:MFS family permease